jgi:ATP-dependent helicase/nuclease subunit A
VAPLAARVREAEAAADRPALPPLPDYRLRRIVRPSSAFASADPDRVFETTAERLGDPRDPDAARRDGIALHALLQHLSRIEPGLWPAVAVKALPVLVPDRPKQHAAIIDKARSILTRADFAHLFGQNSRAEVPILAQGRRNGLPVTIAGRIDRLVVEPGRVLIVDFKSDALAPETVPAAYLAQLGLYALVAGLLFPGHEVAAAILWTGPESLSNLSSDGLLKAVSDFTIG